MQEPSNRRVLIIDDNESIHVDFRKIIGPGSSKPGVAVDSAAAELFGDSPAPVAAPLESELDSALQGQEGLARVREALLAEKPYALAFVDVRMPPGWNGVETVQRLWEVDPNLQIVICTAYSDFSWSEVMQVLGETDRLLILKKPFDNVEMRQITSAMIAKWNLTKEACRARQDLQEMIHERTQELLEAKLPLPQQDASQGQRSDLEIGARI